MKTTIFLKITIVALLFICNFQSFSQSKKEMENEAWQMEVQYWKYVQNSDTISYKKLWHKDFVGYPSFSEGVSTISKIAVWIKELHKDTSLKFSYKLYKKAANAIEGVVITFYDVDEIWIDRNNKIIKKQTYKFTHTWKKDKNTWLILGGLAAQKMKQNSIK